MSILEILAKLIGGWLIGWVEQRVEARKQEAVQEKVIRDDQTIANQQHTIQIEETRHEVDESTSTDSRQQLIDKLRSEGAIRKE